MAQEPWLGSVSSPLPWAPKQVIMPACSSLFPPHLAQGWACHGSRNDQWMKWMCVVVRLWEFTLWNGHRRSWNMAGFLFLMPCSLSSSCSPFLGGNCIDSGTQASTAPIQSLVNPMKHLLGLFFCKMVHSLPLFQFLTAFCNISSFNCQNFYTSPILQLQKLRLREVMWTFLAAKLQSGTAKDLNQTSQIPELRIQPLPAAFLCFLLPCPPSSPASLTHPLLSSHCVWVTPSLTDSGGGGGRRRRVGGEYKSALSFHGPQALSWASTWHPWTLWAPSRDPGMQERANKRSTCRCASGKPGKSSLDWPWGPDSEPALSVNVTVAQEGALPLRLWISWTQLQGPRTLCSLSPTWEVKPRSRIRRLGI